MDFIQGKKEGGLVYENNITLGELVDKDTDGDGIPDWEEPLYGLDPTKKETIPGVPDSTALSKIKVDQGDNTANASGYNASEENLTQTDKFSRELFSTVSALNQNGNMDQTSAENLGTSLAKNIQNSVPQKTFTTSDIKITQDNNKKTIKKYNDEMENIAKKYAIKASVTDVFQKFVIDDNNVDASALSELDPIITQIQNRITEVLKISVPQSLASLHLEFLNELEKITENLSDIKLYDIDPVIALKGISQYQKNIDILQSALTNLTNAINSKLNN